MSSNSHNKCLVTNITIQCSYKAIRDRSWTTKHVMLQWTIEKSYDSVAMSWRKMIMHPYNTTTTLAPPLQRLSSHSIPMVTLVTLVTIVPTPRGVSSPAPLILCPMNIIPRVGRTGISVTLIPLRSTFLLSLCVINKTYMKSYYLHVWEHLFAINHSV